MPGHRTRRPLAMAAGRPFATVAVLKLRPGKALLTLVAVSLGSPCRV
ncbi:hypothetical protein [Streptomyces formicae]|uniref:Uncharacterized protein n=1 Tax=Streptomyces formicae TaxID=1616117 RepID=A0ABY3WDU3_9ACTN|nr:hypothetical protein [Streptomyces formicae]UNM10739.1 hypothetical protein J4032_03750 [Streptomyces formicae]